MTHTTSQKNGFEIRLEIMQLAHSHADAEYRSKVESANSLTDEAEKRKALNALRYPTHHEVIAIATTMYDFVSRTR